MHRAKAVDLSLDEAKNIYYLAIFDIIAG